VNNVNKEEEVSADDALDDFLTALRKVWRLCVKCDNSDTFMKGQYVYQLPVRPIA
jgi:hypothetical protein